MLALMPAMTIFQIDRRSISNFDFLLFAMVLTANIVGIVNLSSASIGTGLWKTQTYWFLISLAVFTAVLFVDYQQYEKMAGTIFVLGLVLLVGVHFFGHKVGGARSWYRLGIGNFQPSEVMKIAIILMLARYYRRDTAQRVWGPRELVWPAFVVGVPLALILKEPDLGTALVIALFFTTMLLFAGVRRGIILAGVIFMLVSIYPAWNWVLRPHQKDRIMIFLDPDRDRRDEGYQAFQAKIAVGSGGLFGKGFKRGKVHMLRFLPEQQTDFVIAVWAEEWGFVWVTAVIALYAGIIVRCIGHARQAKDRFGMMVVVGCSALLFWHIFINIAMVVGIFPIIGAPLPFMTYGGSNLLTFMIAIALILNVRMRKYFF